MKEVPYNISVALIKICQLNNYAPLEIEKYYQSILPSFHLLRRTDGTKYQSYSIKTVRAAMLSSRLFDRTEDGLYELNIPNALEQLKIIQNKYIMTKNNLEEKEKLKKEKTPKSPKKEVKKYKKIKPKNDEKDLIESISKKKYLGKKKKLGLKMRNLYRMKTQKYIKAYELFNNLIKISSDNKNLISNLNFDEELVTDESALSQENPNFNKVIGILSAFKFFKPFLEKHFNSLKIHDNVVTKLAELSSEVRYIDALYRSEE